MWDVVVIVLCVAGALLLLAQTVVQRRIWRRHLREVTAYNAWQQAKVGAPFGQDGSGPPVVTSPYAIQHRPLPPKPGAGRLIWAGVLVVVALLVFFARLA